MENKGKCLFLYDIPPEKKNHFVHYFTNRSKKQL